MSDLDDLYQEVIMDHSRKPRNFRVMENPTRKIEGYNPLCGDRFTIYLQTDGEFVRDISFQGAGCAISKASASMMTRELKGKKIQDTEIIFEKFRRMLSREAGTEFKSEGLGKLEAFAGVCEFPARVKCATLAWHTMHAALKGKEESISTE